MLLQFSLSNPESSFTQERISRRTPRGRQYARKKIFASTKDITAWSVPVTFLPEGIGPVTSALDWEDGVLALETNSEGKMRSSIN